MHKILLALIFLIAGCQQNQLEQLTPQAIGDHQTAKVTHVLVQTAGTAVVSQIELKKYEKLKKFWEPQKKNYCGVCSNCHRYQYSEGTAISQSGFAVHQAG